MLESLEAIEFIQELGSGRTLPVLVRAERADGEQFDVVVKLSASECGLGGLVREAFAGMLAADLGLPVSKPFLVNFSVAFLDIVPPQSFEAKDRIANSVSPTFGTMHIKGVHAYPPGRRIPQNLISVASEIVAFDGICGNHDRWAEKPNCLTDGKNKLVMIDHELALMVDATLGTFFNPYPWAPCGMQTLVTSPHKHILLPEVKGKGETLDRLEQSWNLLTAERFREYAKAIPAEWDPTNQIVTPILKHLDMLRDHTKELFSEARRILQ